jgi:hypothetical protein
VKQQRMHRSLEGPALAISDRKRLSGAPTNEQCRHILLASPLEELLAQHIADAATRRPTSAK